MVANSLGEAKLRLLGPVIAVHEGETVASPSAMVRTLLALLALNAGSSVSTSVIIEELWGASLPKDPRSALQVLAARLRKWLPTAGIEPHSLRYEQDSYVLDVAEYDVDVARFTVDVVAAIQGGADATARLAAAERALAWWRGEPFTGCVPGSRLETEAGRLEELRLTVEELRHEMMLSLGRHNEIIADLGALVAQYPARERLAKLAMLALYRADRQQEALAVFQSVRRHLVEEYGLDVSADLVDLEARILAQDDQLFARQTTVEVTLVFTDIEGSTALAHELGDQYIDVLGEHNRILREAIQHHHGDEIHTEGDSFFAAFGSPEDAVRACLAAQLELDRHEWSHGRPVRVRIGIHTGTAIRLDRDFAGLNVHLASRIGAAGHGGQVVVSRQTLDALGNAAEFEWIDLGAHQLKDFPDPILLYQLAHTDLVTSFPALRTLDAPRDHNLPAQVTSFIGRERELDDLRSMLCGEARLVSLTGPGGIGKTRLAVEAAWSVLSRFRGAWFVDFAAVTDPAAILDVVAAALDVGERPETTPRTLVVEKLAAGPSLLVLDNLEHLLSGVVAVSDLLAACPTLVVLATSRERLRLQGEFEVLLDGLDDTDSVQLFAARAAMARRDVVLDDHVDELCRRIEGMPLAIELAAARLRAQSVEQLLATMDTMLNALSEGERDRPERHQAMRASIAASVDSLTEAEQRVFRAFATFAGGATSEAILAVSAPKADEVQSLLDKSLIRSDGERFTMLEPIRQFADEMLANDVPGEREQRIDAHARFFLEFAERLEPDIVTARQQEVLDRLSADHANLRLAIDRGAGDIPLRIAACLTRFWTFRGHTHEGRAVLAYALANTSSVDPSVRSKALIGAANLAVLQADTAAAVAAGEEAVALGDPHLVGHARLALGDAARTSGDLDAAEREFEAAVAAAGSDEALLVKTRTSQGALAFARGDLEAAEAAWRDALDLSRRIGDKWAECVAVGNLGTALRHSNRWDEAIETFERSREIAESLGDLAGGAAARLNIAGALQAGETLEGDRQAEAAEHVFAAIQTFEALGYRRELANALLATPAVIDDLDETLRAIRRARALYESINDAAGVARADRFRDAVMESCSLG